MNTPAGNPEGAGGEHAGGGAAFQHHPDLREHTILIVDDEPANLGVMSDYLEGFGLEVLIARDGKSGLKKARYARPDLVLLDVRMPGTDGFETCRRLKADKTTSDIPVIFMTILADTEDKVKGFEAGGVDFITKPFQHEEVLARITSHLRLRDLTCRLQEAKETLERRVEERTAELSRANEELQAEIDERKLAEEALRASEERYHSLFDRVPVGLYRTTPGGQILDANPALIQMLGYPDREALLAESVTNLYVDLEVRKQLEALLKREGVVRDFEIQLRRQDGTIMWAKDTCRIVRDSDGRVLHYEGSLADITEQKRAEEEKERLQAQLLQAQKMEAFGRLAGGVAHDFNNLLTAISGYGQLLLSEFGPEDPQVQDVEEILKAAARATSLTGQLLAFSRRQVLQPQVLDLNGLVVEMEKMLRRLIGEDIDLSTVFGEQLERVQADPGQIEQVVMNLAVNAREAMPQGGRLTIKTENVMLGEEEGGLHPDGRPGRFICLSVADAGAGINKEVMERVFEPFVTTKPDGTGLGLSVVYGIVRQHEGWIEVASEPGRGSIFKIYLPATSAEPEPKSEKKTARRLLQGRGERVLVVEDDEGVGELARRTLEENGYVVHRAANIKEALEVFEQQEADFQLVFSDVVLPDGTAMELVDRLLSRQENLRVVLSSGYMDEKLRWSELRERGFRFLQKPYAPADLLGAAREAIDSPR